MVKVNIFISLCQSESQTSFLEYLHHVYIQQSVGPAFSSGCHLAQRLIEHQVAPCAPMFVQPKDLCQPWPLTDCSYK